MALDAALTTAAVVAASGESSSGTASCVTPTYAVSNNPVRTCCVRADDELQSKLWALNL